MSLVLRDLHEVEIEPDVVFGCDANRLRRFGAIPEYLNAMVNLTTIQHEEEQGGDTGFERHQHELLAIFGEPNLHHTGYARRIAFDACRGETHLLAQLQAELVDLGRCVTRACRQNTPQQDPQSKQSGQPQAKVDGSLTPIGQAREKVA